MDEQATKSYKNILEKLDQTSVKPRASKAVYYSNI